MAISFYHFTGIVGRRFRSEFKDQNDCYTWYWDLYFPFGILGVIIFVVGLGVRIFVIATTGKQTTKRFPKMMLGNLQLRTSSTRQ